MTMNFNKQICIKNIYHLAKINNIRLGELETHCGVTIGTLSRLSKEKNTANPGIEFLVLAADMLNVSLESLVNTDMTKPAKTETYILNFVNHPI